MAINTQTAGYCYMPTLLVLTLPASSSSTDDSKQPSRLAFRRKEVGNRTARGTASSLPTVTPPQNKLMRTMDGNGAHHQGDIRLPIPKSCKRVACALVGYGHW